MPSRCSGCLGPRQSGSRQPEVKCGCHTQRQKKCRCKGSILATSWVWYQQQTSSTAWQICFSFSGAFKNSPAPLGTGVQLCSG